MFATGLRSFGLAAFLVPALLLSSSLAQSDYERHGFSAHDGELFRGRRAFTLRTLEKLELGNPHLSLEQKIKALNQVCFVGANTVLVNLKLDGPARAELDSNWLESFNTLVDETRWRSMGVILRVFPPGSIRDPQKRRVVVRDLANLLKDRWDVVYWIEGPGSSDMLSLFKSLAPRLVTAAEKGGDITVITRNSGSSSAGGGYLWLGELPSDQRTHFVLPASSENYSRLFEHYSGLDRNSQAGNVQANGSLQLFDGTSLKGWTVIGDASGWTAKDGTIQWVHRGGGDLRFNRVFQDFQLRLDWKISEGGNSGIFLRAPLAGRESRIGIEVQLLGDHGKAPHKNGTGSLYDVAAPRSNASRPAGEWNTLEIRCQGSRLQATLNDQLIHDIDLDQHSVLKLRLKKGFIVLQDHGHFVAFRNITLTPLDSNSTAPVSSAR